MAEKKKPVTLMDEMNGEAENETTVETGLPANPESVIPGEEKHNAVNNLKAKAELDEKNETKEFDDFTDDDFEEKSGAFLKTENIPAEPTQYIFDGFQTLELPAMDGSGELQKTKCAVLIDKQKNRWLCASTVVVRGMEQVTTIPAPVRLQNLGQKLSANKTRYYDVKYWIAKGFAKAAPHE